MPIGSSAPPGREVSLAQARQAHAAICPRGWASIAAVDDKIGIIDFTDCRPSSIFPALEWTKTS
jgi:hypothetical protein